MYIKYIHHSRFISFILCAICLIMIMILCRYVCSYVGTCYFLISWLITSWLRTACHLTTNFIYLFRFTRGNYIISFRLHTFSYILTTFNYYLLRWISDAKSVPRVIYAYPRNVYIVFIIIITIHAILKLKCSALTIRD